MPLDRRDFMKILGISVASLIVNRACVPGCYAPVPPATVLPIAPTLAPNRERLQRYWLRFEELAQKSHNDGENKLGKELIAGHRAELDELVANGELSAHVADLVQEAYEAAVYHVWRSNAPITCYKMVVPNYAPSSAAVLVEQSKILSQLAEAGAIDQTTLEKAQTALEHDMAFYALTDEEVKALYDQIGKESEQGQSPPSFEALSLELTPEAEAATQFIIDMLTGR